MMLLLSALHRIAAQRGEGLRPELIRLLQHAKADPEIECASAASENIENRCSDHPGPQPAPLTPSAASRRRETARTGTRMVCG